MIEQFKIRSGEEIIPAEQILCIQLGPDYLGYSISAIHQNKLIDLCWYGVKKLNKASLDNWFQETPTLQQFQKVNVCFDNNQNILLPGHLNDGDHVAALYLNGANQQDKTFQELTKSGDITNVYSVPYQIHDWLLSKFQDVNLIHLKTLLINNLYLDSNAGSMDVIIFNNTFCVVVAKANRLLLAQTFAFSSPADVLFYLLKITGAYGLSQETITIRLSGLIDKDSTLFEEIYQYFLNVTFRDSTWDLPVINSGYPLHLFTSLNLLALCEL